MQKNKYPIIAFEFTVKDTRQQNGRIEAEIATTWKQVRAMLDGIDIPDYNKKQLLTEAFNTALMVDGIIVKPNQDRCADEK